MAEVESIEKEVTTTSIVIKSVVALALGILILMLPRPENLTPEGHRLLALLTTVVILWVVVLKTFAATDPVPAIEVIYVSIFVVITGFALIRQSIAIIIMLTNAWAPI